MPKQYEFVRNISFQSALFGGFGNGKTTALCFRALMLALAYPKALGLIGRATYPELRDSTIRTFFEVCPSELISKYNKQGNTVYLQNGAQILFRAFNDPIKVLSMNLGWFGIDQAEEISEELYLQLLGRLRNPECRFAFGVGNPEPGWVKKRFKDNRDHTETELLLLECTTEENPHLPKDYLDNLKKYYPDQWLKRYYYGDWCFFEGQVFSEFTESKHVIDPFELPQTWRHEYIVDYGYRNPFAVLDIVISHDDEYFVVNEHYEREQVISWHVDKMKQMGIDKKSMIWIDPSCSAKTREKNGVQVSIIDEFNECGLFPIPANNNISGTLRVNQWFKDSRLKIFRNCTNTIREVSELRWKKVKPDFNANLPEKEEDKNNHCTDSLKYFANSRPNAPEAPKHPNWYQKSYYEAITSVKKGIRKDSDWYND